MAKRRKRSMPSFSGLVRRAVDIPRMVPRVSFGVKPYRRANFKPFQPVEYKPYAVEHIAPVSRAFRKGPVGKDDGARKSNLSFRDKKTAGDAVRRASQKPKRIRSQRERKVVEPSKKSLETRDPLKCKERPDSKLARKGSGGSRDFVPWCK